VDGLGDAAGEQAAMAPMRARTRTIRLIMGNLGIGSPAPDPAMAFGEGAGVATG